MQMKAAVLYGKEDLQIESVAVPSIGDGDVLVRVQAALTCGTDVKVFRRGYHARMIVPPALFGHEMSGDIVAVGKDVRNFHIGQRVVAAIPPRVWSASTASGAARICVRICCSTTALTPNTFVFRRALWSAICTKFHRTSLIRTLPWWNHWRACCAGLTRPAIAPGRHGSGDRSGTDRPDVCAPGEVLWRARSGIGPAQNATGSRGRDGSR